MIPTGFRVLGTGGSYKLVGMRLIGNGHIDTGIVPRFGYESSITIASFDLSGESTQIVSGVQYDANRICQIFIEKSQSSYYVRYSHTTSDDLNPIPFSSFTYPLTISMNEGDYSVNNNTYDYGNAPRDLSPSMNLYLFFGNGSNSTAYFKGVISEWSYSDDIISAVLKPEIQPDNSVKMVDQLTGRIPTHVGEFEPVYDKSANDGDCLIDGRFSKAAPDGVVTGGSCLVDGADYFHTRADVIKVTGDFDALEDMENMFYGTANLTEVNATFPSARILKGAFWLSGISAWHVPLPSATNLENCFRQSKIKTLVLDAPNATTTATFCYACSMLQSVVINLPKGSTLVNTFAACISLVDVSFTAPMSALTTATFAFDRCTKLTSQSIDNIVAAMPTHWTARDIGFAGVPMTQAQYDAFVAKGWTPVGAIIS